MMEGGTEKPGGGGGGGMRIESRVITEMKGRLGGGGGT